MNKSVTIIQVLQLFNIFSGLIYFIVAVIIGSKWYWKLLWGFIFVSNLLFIILWILKPIPKI